MSDGITLGRTCKGCPSSQRQSRKSHENKTPKKASQPSPRKASGSRRLPLGKRDRPKDSADSVKLSKPSHIGPDLTTGRG